MNVNDKKRGRPFAQQPHLSAELILKTAKSLMKEDGKVPSLRLLAMQLNADPMAIYHYFKSKQILLDALTTSLVAEIYLPSEKLDWQHELKLLCVSYIELLREYNGLLQTILTMASNGPAEVFTQRYRLIISRLALPNELATDSLNLLADYLHGFAFSICYDSQRLLNTEMIDGPIKLICNALEVHRKNTTSSF